MNKRKFYASRIQINEGYEGLSIEREIEQLTTNKEPISADAPQLFTERKDGVLPEYDIRTDRFEIAIETVDKAIKSQKAQREELLKSPKNEAQTPTEGATEN